MSNLSSSHRLIKYFSITSRINELLNHINLNKSNVAGVYEVKIGKEIIIMREIEI